MFTTKQSDVFYNDQTREMFVCKVSSISGKRCEDSDTIVYGALPIIYKIDKDTNYQSVVYPANLTTFTTDIKTDLYELLPSCSEGTNFAHVTKPLINYNKSTDRYSVTFIGKYTATSDGFGVLNYIFQHIDTRFHLLDSKILIPKSKTENTVFTFKSGYVHSDYIIGGNPVRFADLSIDTNSERVTDYLIPPTHVEYNDSLGFNLINNHTSIVLNLTGNKNFPLQWAGGYITQNPEYIAYDPKHSIRVDFRAKSFTVPAMTAYRSKQAEGFNATATNKLTATRWIEKVTDSSDPALSGAGAGFCVYFYKNPSEGIVEPNGVSSTLGYAEAGNIGNEIDGKDAEVQGLVVNTGSVGSGEGYLADSFLGVGFDIRGNFCTTSETKPGALSAYSTGVNTWTTAPCSVGIRGNRSHETRVLTCISLSDSPGAAVPMHEEATTSNGSDIDFQDYRIDLTNEGTQLKVYNKLTTATDYNTILELDLNRTYGCVGYDAWGNIGEPLVVPPTIEPLNVGLTFTTSDFCSFFELSSFEVTGVQINSPRKIPEEIENVETVNYLEESSANLRRSLISLKSGLVDIEMSQTVQSLIDRISLCSVLPDITDIELDAKWTSINTDTLIGDLPGPPKVSVGGTLKASPCEKGWYSEWAPWGIGPSISNATIFDKDAYSGKILTGDNVVYWSSGHAPDDPDYGPDWVELITSNGDKYLAERVLIKTVSVPLPSPGSTMTLGEDFMQALGLKENFNPELKISKLMPRQRVNLDGGIFEARYKWRDCPTTVISDTAYMRIAEGVEVIGGSTVNATNTQIGQNNKFKGADDSAADKDSAAGVEFPNPGTSTNTNGSFEFRFIFNRGSSTDTYIQENQQYKVNAVRNQTNEYDLVITCPKMENGTWVIAGDAPGLSIEGEPHIFTIKPQKQVDITLKLTQCSTTLAIDNPKVTSKQGRFTYNTKAAQGQVQLSTRQIPFNIQIDGDGPGAPSTGFNTNIDAGGKEEVTITFNETIHVWKVTSIDAAIDEISGRTVEFITLLYFISGGLVKSNGYLITQGEALNSCIITNWKEEDIKG